MVPGCLCCYINSNIIRTVYIVKISQTQYMLPVEDPFV